MRNQLTEFETKKLKFQCRMAYVLAFFMALILSAILFLVFYLQGLSFGSDLFSAGIASVFVLSVLLIYGINRKYYADIRYREKEVQIKTLHLKEVRSAYFSGVSTTKTEHQDEKYHTYSIVADGFRYTVKKELYESLQEGDQLAFLYAPKSKFLLGIRKYMP